MNDFDMNTYNKNDRIHIIILNTVFDITTYQTRHPGGKMSIVRAIEKNGIECLITKHRRNFMKIIERLDSLAVGRVHLYDKTKIEAIKA